MARLNWTAEAQYWLKDIHDYIAKDNPQAATKVVNEIYNKAQILTGFPDIGYVYSNEPDGEIRILLYGHYRIAYFNKGKVIDILGVFHGAMDIEQYLPQLPE